MRQVNRQKKWLRYQSCLKITLVITRLKGRKLKAMLPLSSDLLHLHAQALYSLLMKPCVKPTRSWKTISDGIYSRFGRLSKQLQRVLNSKKLIWINTKALWYQQKLVMKILEPRENFDENYEDLELDVREMGLGVLVVKEGVHTPIFKNNMQRLRFFVKLHLSVSTDLITFCPGGSHTSISE